MAIKNPVLSKEAINKEFWIRGSFELIVWFDLLDRTNNIIDSIEQDERHFDKTFHSPIRYVKVVNYLLKNHYIIIDWIGNVFYSKWDNS